MLSKLGRFKEAHKHLSGGCPYFQPIATLQARVHRILALDHHTFETQRFDFLKQCLAIADDVIGKPMRPVLSFARMCFKSVLRSALLERLARI